MAICGHRGRWPTTEAGAERIQARERNHPEPPANAPKAFGNRDVVKPKSGTDTDADDRAPRARCLRRTGTLTMGQPGVVEVSGRRKPR